MNILQSFKKSFNGKKTSNSNGAEEGYRFGKGVLPFSAGFFTRTNIEIGGGSVSNHCCSAIQLGSAFLFMW